MRIKVFQEDMVLNIQFLEKSTLKKTRNSFAEKKQILEAIKLRAPFKHFREFFNAKIDQFCKPGKKLFPRVDQNFLSYSFHK